MGIANKLLKQTFIYGLATVLPRMLSFLLVPLYTSVMAKEIYGEVSVIFTYFILFNVVLSYGMETAFFRFFNKEKNKDSVVATSAISLLISSICFFATAFLIKDWIADITNIKGSLITLVLWVLLLDALVIIPFAWLRANERPMRYAMIKIINVTINLGLNILLLLFLHSLTFQFSVFDIICKDDFEANYILISNLIASAVTLLILLSFYIKIKYHFDTKLWKKMMRYALPVLVAGICFSINESFDKLLLDRMLPEKEARAAVGVYAACYKLALFMTLFATAFRLGIEPFFFKQSGNKNAPETYAMITKYFVILGALIFIGVVTFIPILKRFILPDPAYWEALAIVPIILLANFCLGIYHNLSVWYKVTDRTKFGAYISVIGAVITLLLNVVLIPKYSYMGSAIATLAAYSSMMVLSWYYGQKYYPIPYPMKRMVMLAFMSIGFSGVAFYVFDLNYLVSIPLLLTFLVVLWVTEGKQVKKILSVSKK